MAKVAVVHACSECGYQSPRWFGRCPGCGTFGSLAEETVGPAPAAARPLRPLLRLAEVES